MARQKLNREQVRTILKALDGGADPKTISEKFDISHDSIERLARGEQDIYRPWVAEWRRQNPRANGFGHVKHHRYSDEEIGEIRVLRTRGLSYSQIGAKLKIPAGSVYALAQRPVVTRGLATTPTPRPRADRPPGLSKHIEGRFNALEVNAWAELEAKQAAERDALTRKLVERREQVLRQLDEIWKKGN